MKKILFYTLIASILPSCALLENCQNYDDESSRNECVARHSNSFFFGAAAAQSGADAANGAATSHQHHHSMGGAGMMPGM